MVKIWVLTKYDAAICYIITNQRIMNEKGNCFKQGEHNAAGFEAADRGDFKGGLQGWF
ncbi:MAG: hypothetical protein IKC30_06990 [Rikenellaceae bacterium]|nr:hypothetical protein [Rikenellaceae bacterium]